MKKLPELLVKLRTYFGAHIFCIILNFTRRYYEDKIDSSLITKGKHNELKSVLNWQDSEVKICSKIHENSMK